VLEAKLRQLHGIFLSLDRVAGDLELQVERQKREIVAGDVTHQREDLGLPGLFGGQKLGARRFSGASQLAKKIELKAHIARIRRIFCFEGEAAEGSFIRPIAR
jgi:hypothetical protein